MGRFHGASCQDTGVMVGSLVDKSLAHQSPENANYMNLKPLLYNLLTFTIIGSIQQTHSWTLIRQSIFTSNQSHSVI